jgi:AcrR family transcriptional regulator
MRRGIAPACSRPAPVLLLSVAAVSISGTNMKLKRRPYRMRARADAAAETARRIVNAMQELFAEKPYDRITVDAAATRAGVTVQTVLRRFGSKEGLFVAAVQEGRAQILAQRGAAPVGNPASAVKNLFDHYERWGRTVMRVLEQEERIPQVGAIAREGRRTHAEWVDRVFEPELVRLRARARARRRTQLITLTDVYVWKLLRRDLTVPRADAEEIVLGMIDALCAHGGK